MRDTWRDRLIKRRDLLNTWRMEDERNRREGFIDPGSKHYADSVRKDLQDELFEVELLCALAVDAAECF